MATFGDLRTILRDDILAEASTDYFSDADLLDFLKRAAEEIAAALGFPRSILSANLVAGDVSFQLDPNVSAIIPGEVVVDGYRLAPASASKVTEYQTLGTSFPRFYNADRRTFGTGKDSVVVLFGPPVAASATATVEAVVIYDASSDTTSDPPWSGDYEQFHEIVALRAAEKAFRASLEYEKAKMYQQEYQRQYAEFAAYLGDADLGTRQAPPVVPQ